MAGVWNVYQMIKIHKLSVHACIACIVEFRKISTLHQPCARTIKARPAMSRHQSRHVFTRSVRPNWFPQHALRHLQHDQRLRNKHLPRWPDLNDNGNLSVRPTYIESKNWVNERAIAVFGKQDRRHHHAVPGEGGWGNEQNQRQTVAWVNEAYQTICQTSFGHIDTH